MKQVSAYLLFDDQNRALLMHRTSDAPTHPNYWGFFGGKIENKETPRMAAQREAQEELNIKLKNIKLFKTYKQKDSYGEQIRHIFVGHLHHPLSRLRAQQTEGSDLNVFTLSELSDIKISKNDLRILKDVYHYSIE